MLVIERKLQERGVSPVKFARSIGVSHVTVYRWLNNQIKPCYRLIPILEKEFGMPYWGLFEKFQGE